MAEATESVTLDETTIPEFRDYYLKFNSEEEAQSILYSKVPENVDESDPDNPVVTSWVKGDNGEELLNPNFASIATVGLVYKPTGEMIRIPEEGVPEANQMQYPAMSPIEGWHVNVRVLRREDPSVLEPYRTNPDPVTPIQVFA